MDSINTKLTSGPSHGFRLIYFGKIAPWFHC